MKEILRSDSLIADTFSCEKFKDCLSSFSSHAALESISANAAYTYLDIM